MDSNAAASAQLLEEQLRANDARRRLDRRQELKDFALVLALIVFALAVSSLLADLGANTH
jgi:hypothetical protein